MDPSPAQPSDLATADRAVLTSIFMGLQGLGIVLSSGCGGLYGGMMGAMGIVGLADGSMPGMEAGILLVFSAFKWVGVAMALATGAFLLLGSYQMSQGRTRMVHLAAMAGVATPVLLLMASIMTCSIIETMIWFIWLPLGSAVLAMSLQTHPERHRDTW